MATTTKAARGTKRTCRNDDCEIKFYDLNRDPIVCPACQTEYVLARQPEEEVIMPVVAPVAKAVAPAAADGDAISDDDDALVSLEDADAELGGDDDEDDETFLAEDEDDDPGVGDIIGGVEAEDEET